uniref:Uncharacterized protein n=1 Tax=Glossina palpalis gambiensis TaxID=67801 RepID=A0A1B0BEY9_9MUSC
MLVTFSRDDCRDQKQNKATRYTLTNKIDLCKAKLQESPSSTAILLCAIVPLTKHEIQYRTNC